ncbi:polysaccharide deacetylase [Clostridium sp. CAG:575]|nr:polysaccharide deacetylase [Clostridium sp. CAG:575]
MGLFYNKGQYQGYNIYSMKKYVDKKRIILSCVVATILVITLMLTIYYIVDTSIRVKKSKKYEEQVIAYKQQLEEQEKIEKEKKEAERLSRIPNLTEEGKENIKNIYHSETAKRAFLTFDDGPSTNTKDILDLLLQRNIKATFFVLGTQVERMPETVKRIYEEGHYIANHGYSHVYSSIYSSPEAVLDEFNKCNQVVANAIQVPEYNSHLFRFPGGYYGGKYAEIKKQANEILKQNNIAHVDWNALTGDSEKQNPTKEYLMNNLQKTTQGKNSIVILMHDSQAKKVTVETLPEVIDYLQQQGYEFENFYSIIK